MENEPAHGFAILSLCFTGEMNVMNYTNHRGEKRLRRFRPINLYYGTSDFHEGFQWFVNAVDHDKGEMRTFALSGFLE